MVLEILKQCIVDGNMVRLPEGQLDRELYLNVKDKLESIGGKWKGGKTQGFIFDNDPTELLGSIANGEEINLKQDYQFFATPQSLADQMISRIPFYESGMRVCEPSAGDGALVKAFVRRFGADMVRAVECFEVMEQNLSKLQSVRGAMMKGTDFLSANIPAHEHYDIIIANPPFSSNQDIEHIRKMYEVCRPGGLIITVASPSWTFGTQKKQVEFREWLASINAVQEEIPAGTFKSSGTGVGAMLLEIKKPFNSFSNNPIPIEGVEKFVAARKENRLKKQTKIRACRVCGCTEDDCRQCIEKTGSPCHWVEKDLCSACVEPLRKPEEILEDLIQSQKEIDKTLLHLKQLFTSPNYNDMNFFKLLHQSVPGADITLRVKEKNGKYTVSVLNNVGGQSNLQPLIVTGIPNELDEKFFELIALPVAESTAQLQNLEAFKASLKEEVKKVESQSVKKPAEPAKGKEEKASPKPVKTPKPETKNSGEPDLFDGLGDDDDETGTSDPGEDAGSEDEN